MSFFRKYKNIWYGLSALLLLIGLRMYCTHTLAFGFLFWNLFLAVLPLFFCHLATTTVKPYRAWAAAACWLLFFPNSPYLLTDMVHLYPGDGLRYWLDVVILVLSAIYGIAMGMISLKQMEGWYGHFVSARIKPLITMSLLMLCGYGIYLGRVERWNSWDVVAQPVDLFHAMAYHYRHPFRSREVWMMSGLFGAGLYVLYLLFNKRQSLDTRIIQQ